MFADISGFTAMAETADAEDVRNVVNDSFETLVPIIERYGGTIDKFIGDCIMALFGASVAHENDPERALLAALEMQTAFTAFARARGLSLGLHFGINTGPVIAGSIGSLGRRDFSVIGDAVNLAARLEDLSESGEVLIGPETWRQTTGRFDFEPLPPVTLKGKQAPVAVYRLRGRRIGGMENEAVRSPFVGRGRELATIGKALKAASRGVGGAIEIVGETGVGKTRLLDEARKRGSNLRWLEVQCQSHRRSTGFGLARGLLLRLAGCPFDAEPELVLRAMMRAAEAISDGQGDAHFAHLATLVGFGEDERVAAHLEDVPERALGDRFAGTVRLLMAAEAAAQPLAIACEDLHWCDDSSLDLLGRIAAGGPIAGCLVIYSRRPDPDALPLPVAAEAIPQLRLEPLDETESRALLDALVETGTGDNDAARRILERAEGNPFFLEELVQALIDRGALERRGARAVAVKPFDEAALPLTLQGVMMARLDELPAGGKETLQTAAVIGRMFDVDLLEQVTRPVRSASGGLPELLASLTTRDFISPRGTSLQPNAYRFNHVVTQEVAYQSLLMSRRRALHSAIVDALLPFADDDGRFLAPIMAYHCENAGREREAGKWLLAAANIARKGHANAEAAAFYRRVLDMRPSLKATGGEGSALLASASEGMGEVLLLRGELADANAMFRAALELVPADRFVQRAAILRRCAQVAMADRKAEEASQLYAEARNGLDAGGARDAEWWSEWIRISLDWLWPLYWIGRHDQMQDILDSAVTPVAAHGSQFHRARLLSRHVMLRFERERAFVTRETIALAREALDAATIWGGLRGLTVARQTLAYALLMHGDHDGARPHLEEALALARRTGDVDQEVLAMTNAAFSRRLAGDVDQTATLGALALEAAQRSEGAMQIAFCEALLAWVALRLGNTIEATALAERAVACWDKRGFRMQWVGRWTLIAIAVESRDWNLALRHARVLRQRDHYRAPPEVEAALDVAILGNSNGDERIEARAWNAAVAAARVWNYC